ncbi:MAG: uroporphyrinogen decarboxylase [Acidobacteriota bacterium]
MASENDPVRPRAGGMHPSEDSVFMRACRRQSVPYTPIWLMRQAGRFMKEYRDIRERVSMRELCATPDLVEEVTVHAATTLGVDAAIIFSDLLLIVEPMGLTLDYLQGSGPSIQPAVRDAAAIDRLREVDPAALEPVYAGVRQARAALPATMPLIGFAGAPFTLASYVIEGGASRRFLHTKSLMYRDEGAWHALMEKIVRGVIPYLCRQVEAGAQALQVFDSWVGCLSPADYRRYVQPHSRALLAALPDRVPVIHFGTGTATLLHEMAAAGGDLIGIDWRTDLRAAWSQLGEAVGIMGNLDPLALLGGDDVLRREVTRILGEVAACPGHVFNLGHGVVPETSPAAARRLVEMVHEISRR